MRVVVIVPPEPIAKPTEIPGGQSGDAFLLLMISAAQAEIDGPTGWLGRALGPQTLELTASEWPCELPYPPFIEFLSASVDGAPVNGVTVSTAGRLRIPDGAPAGEVVLRWRAGYDGTKTPAVPPNARAAVILATNMLRSLNRDDVFVEQEQVNGVGSTTWTVSKDVSEALERTIGNLLAPLRVWA